MNNKNIDLFLTLQPHGWSTCSLYVDGIMHPLVISHVFGEPYVELINALSKLIQGEKTVSFIWYKEPGGHKISLTTIKGQPQQACLVVQTFDSSFEEEIQELEEVVTLLLPTKAFITLAYLQLKKIELLLGIPSFTQNKNGQFPFKRFKELEQKAKAYLNL